MHEQFPPQPAPDAGAQLVQRLSAEVLNFQPPKAADERRGDHPIAPDSTNPHDDHAHNFANMATPFRAEVTAATKPLLDPVEYPDGIPTGWGNEEAVRSKYGHVLADRERDGRPRVFVLNEEDGREREVPPQYTAYPWRGSSDPRFSQTNPVVSNMCVVRRIPSGAESLTTPALPPAREAIPLRPAFADQQTVEMKLPPVPEAPETPDATETTEMPVVTLSAAAPAEYSAPAGANQHPHPEVADVTATQPIRVDGASLGQGWHANRKDILNGLRTEDDAPTPRQGIPQFDPEAPEYAPYGAADTTQLSKGERLLRPLPVDEDTRPPVNHRGERRRISRVPLLIGAVIATGLVGGAAYLGVQSAGEGGNNKQEALPDRSRTSAAPTIPEYDSAKPSEKPRQKKVTPSPSDLPSLPFFSLPSAEAESARPPAVEKPKPTEKPSTEAPEPTPEPTPPAPTPEPSETIPEEPTPEPSETATEEPTPTPSASATSDPEQPLPEVDMFAQSAAILRADALLKIEAQEQVAQSRWERVRKVSKTALTRLVGRA